MRLGAFQGWAGETIPWKVRLFAVLLHELGEQGGPSCLVACADARAVVAVKIFVKENQISPVGIGLEPLFAAIERPPAVAGAQENSGQPMRELLGHFPQSQHFARTRRAFNQKVIAQVMMKLLERLDQ